MGSKYKNKMFNLKYNELHDLFWKYLNQGRKNICFDISHIYLYFTSLQTIISY